MDTYERVVGAANGGRITGGAAAHADDADGRATETKESLNGTQDNAEQVSQGVGLLGGALLSWQILVIWSARGDRREYTHGDRLLAALDAPGVALACGLTSSQWGRCGDRKKGESEQGSSGELHGVS